VPIVSMMRMSGDPDELLSQMNEHIEPVTERLAPAHGVLLNLVARDGADGILVINVWQTDEGRHAMAQEPEMQAALARAGLPAPRFEGYELVAIRAAERLADHAHVVF
jgi:hypothetical protein